MIFSAEVIMGNAAFDPNWRSELGRILRRAASQIELDGADGGALMDINGNRVGSWSVDDPASR